jgi:hypothetical protein
MHLANAPMRKPPAGDMLLSNKLKRSDKHFLSLSKRSTTIEAAANSTHVLVSQ